MRILGPPSADYDTVYANLERLGVHDRFLHNMLPALWWAAVKYSVDPVGVVAQAYHETDRGHFSGLVPHFFYNTAGIKLRHPNKALGTEGDVSLAHSQFASWAHGAEAHVQHLLAYTGTLDMSGRSYLVVDPRAYFVQLKGYREETFEGLSGKWAVPGEGYGERIVEIAEDLMEEV